MNARCRFRPRSFAEAERGCPLTHAPCGAHHDDAEPCAECETMTDNKPCFMCEGTGKWCDYHGANAPDCDCPGTDCAECWGTLWCGPPAGEEVTS